MERDTIAQRIRDFIDREIMAGEGADLTVETPLLELGILDSVSLFLVISFVEDELGVSLPLESLSPEQFQSVSTIAATVEASRSEAQKGRVDDT